MDEYLRVNSMTYHVILHETPYTEQGTLLLLHGFTGSASAWNALATLFTHAGFRVLAIDLPGHGKTDAPSFLTPYRMSATVTAILTILAELHIDPVQTTLLGYSMGGRIALATALATPFHKLILESASPGIALASERASRRTQDADLADRIEREGIVSFVTAWEQLPLFASQQQLPEAIRFVQRQQRLQNAPQGLANSLRGIGTGSQPSYWDRLPSLPTPTLLLAGELDQKYLLIARQMAGLLPQAVLIAFPDVGHTTHLEAPDAFAHTIIRYLIDAPLDITRTNIATCAPPTLMALAHDA